MEKRIDIRGWRRVSSFLTVVTFLMIFCCATNIIAQEQTNGQPQFEPLKDTMPRGVSVSPASIRFSVKSGTSQSKSIKITNDTDATKTFKIFSTNYLAEDINREASSSTPPSDYKYGLTKWL